MATYEAYIVDLIASEKSSNMRRHKKMGVFSSLNDALNFVDTNMESDDIESIKNPYLAVACHEENETSLECDCSTHGPSPALRIQLFKIDPQLL